MNIIEEVKYEEKQKMEENVIKRAKEIVKSNLDYLKSYNNYTEEYKKNVAIYEKRLKDMEKMDYQEICNFADNKYVLENKDE